MAVSMTIYLLLMAVLCCFSSGTEGRLQFEWRKQSFRRKSSFPLESWNLVFDALFHSIEDAEFRKSIKNVKDGKSVGPLGEVFSYCDLSILQCLNYNPIALTLHGMENGTVHFDYLPKTLCFLTVESSTLNQELYIKNLSDNMIQLSFINVTFLSGNATVVLNQTLQRFTCRNCGLHSISFTGESELKMLDLSENKLDTLLFSIPSNITSFIMQNCLYNVSLVKLMRALPPNVVSLDISHSQFSEFMKGIAMIPQSLRSLDVSGFPINTDASFFLNALKSANRGIERLIAKNCGLMGTIDKIGDWKLLRTLDLAQNRISNVVWGNLPLMLKYLDLSANAIEGKLPVGLLSRSLNTFTVSHNAISGPLNIDELPPQLTLLDVRNNNFSGTIDFTRLPESILYVYVQHNKFQGTPDLAEIPAGIEKILIHDNNWDSLFPSY
ncbi:leucine-rich repeat protein, putative [Trypanosoma cruzi marinkellei]|uniref:Leucine-rich repeat protein, putative n=1 Tax=Trypanosoma cruzi marinkellei TaxID=85056 RepID=K2NVJ5_TRYCR|nr:leucine-rich repeat protein, putative [Trypanosoma cruzi marinkellei]